MPKTVYVFPLGQQGIEWLIDHDGELEEKFRQVHRGDRIGVSLDHPHGLSVMLSEAGVLDAVRAGNWDVNEPPVYVYIPCHWNIDHLKSTAEDVREVLTRLGADLKEFEIEKSD